MASSPQTSGKGGVFFFQPALIAVARADSPMAPSREHRMSRFPTRMRQVLPPPAGWLGEMPWSLCLPSHAVGITVDGGRGGWGEKQGTSTASQPNMSRNPFRLCDSYGGEVYSRGGLSGSHHPGQHLSFFRCADGGFSGGRAEQIWRDDQSDSVLYHRVPCFSCQLR